MSMPVFVKKMIKTLGCLALLALACLPVPTHAEGVKDFYKGKTVKLIVGYGAGGGYDTMARTISQPLEKKLGANVVVENWTGGGGLVAFNKLVREDPDGLSIMLLNGSAAALADFLSLPVMRYGLDDVDWIARISTDPNVVVARNGFSLDRGLVKWAGGSKADGIADSAACVSEALALESKIIIGYKGSKESVLSVMRGETDALVVPASSASKYVRGGELKPYMVLSRKRAVQFPDVKTIFELYNLSDEAAWWVDFNANIASLGRVVIAPKGIPEDRLSYISDVLQDVIADEDVVAVLKTRGHLVGYQDGTSVTDKIGVMKQEYSSTKLEKIRNVVLEKYY